MRIALLTSDILDGLMVSGKLLSRGHDIRAIVYEVKPVTLKARVKRALYLLNGAILAMNYEALARRYPALKVVRVLDINSPESGKALGEISPELIIVVGTRKLSADIFGKASRGAINLHSGILPYYRGADSEFWALRNNDIDKIGVTVHFISEDLDAGDILMRKTLKVRPHDDLRSLRMKNLSLGAELLDKTARMIEGGACAGIAQDGSLSLSYKASDRMGLEDAGTGFFKKARRSVYKDFGPRGMRVRERVASERSFGRSKNEQTFPSDSFCLRIDADEYEKGTFNAYYPVFSKYSRAITIFFNVRSFEKAPDEIIKCRGLGIDVGSHGYYHAAYGDYATNRHNIRKAGEFFRNIGIVTTGFAAPTGRYVPSLMKALEDEGYLYSSDFAYDYSGYPSYPCLRDGWSRVLQIPVFPVAPELFLDKRYGNIEAIIMYYENAIDYMISNSIPVIVYAHTSPKYPEVPAILSAILDHAVNRRALKQVSMNDIHEFWTIGKYRVMKRKGSNDHGSGDYPPPDPGFDGEISRLSASEKIKISVKLALDYEPETPSEDLKCGSIKKTLKMIARKFISRRKVI
ncbi:MAG: polysaccharide deacetylase family protein [Candidatus Omnitrophica bacterium]|nr:polysaccharide deacetylase family protein [Candidatus Omnitrophota bacterium]